MIRDFDMLFTTDNILENLESFYIVFLRQNKNFFKKW